MAVFDPSSNEILQLEGSKVADLASHFDRGHLQLTPPAVSAVSASR
jgi:hypothetical protein